ncbi:hypothetical protein [Haloarchaeobius sp. DFWS5]|uniref:hypothetical protein n=1 Tax=Haloarchaeobius sp. DFWS5 TaxID=3446114 RepID=UPI003EBC5874
MKPLWFIAILLNGPTCIQIDGRLIRFLPMTVLDDKDGVIVDGEFVPDDGPGSYFSLYNTPIAIHVADMESLLTPAALQVDHDLLADIRGDTPELLVHGKTKALKHKLAFLCFFAALGMQGATSVHVDSSGNLAPKKMKRVSEPEDGVVVGDEFKAANGAGSFFKRWNVSVAFDIHGMEGLWNPATSEILRAKDAAEERGMKIGAGEDEKTCVSTRNSTLVSAARLADYDPFAMKDGTSTRKQQNAAYEARSKFTDRTTLGRILGLLFAFLLGAISPRLNGQTAGGGGGGGGGFSAPIPSVSPPDILPFVDLGPVAPVAMDVLTVVV